MKEIENLLDEYYKTRLSYAGFNTMKDLMLPLATALDKIRDPRKRDHKEPDKYTECASNSNVPNVEHWLKKLKIMFK